MLTFAAFLELCYFGVAFFYLIAGVLLLLHPPVITNRIAVLFPLLAQFKYHNLGNSLNLIGIGCALLVTAKLITGLHLLGFFVAVLLSLLEVYLGIKFYYYEQRDTFQAVIHVIIHAVIALLVFWFVLTYLSQEVAFTKLQVSQLTSALPI